MKKGVYGLFKLLNISYKKNMDKLNELTKQQKDDEKIFVAKIVDKIKSAQAKNRYENTDFLDMVQQEKAKEILNKRRIENYQFWGGFNESERKELFIFPDYIEQSYDEYMDIYKQQMSCIHIVLPKENRGMYEHRNYLGALMKLGLKREKIGDIIVNNDGADIVISKEISKFILNNLRLLTRFQKAQIEEIELEQIHYIEKEKEIIKINVPSTRLDCIVGELARCSRNEANDIIKQERVLVNFKLELRNSLTISEDSIITIRGKGRFKIDKILGETRSGRLNVQVSKW